MKIGCETVPSEKVPFQLTNSKGKVIEKTIAAPGFSNINRIVTKQLAKFGEAKSHNKWQCVVDFNPTLYPPPFYVKVFCDLNPK